MPILKREDFGTGRAPGWCKIEEGICGMGVWACGLDGQAEPHFHDNEEFWFVIRGRARVRTEGEERAVERGDVVCTRMGDEHAVLEILEAPYEHVWVACNSRGRGRRGHLHRGVDEPA
jgi:mannose-6-phosphate isomerase-like protein (cupin superfamily)